MYFGSNLRKLREDHDLTQKALAAMLKVTRPTIAGYESKNHEPDYSKLLILSDYFHVSIDDLLRKDMSLSPSADYELQTRDKDLKHLELCYDSLSEASVHKLFEYIRLLLLSEQYIDNKEK